MQKSIYSIILAAGEGKRYKNGIKLLHTIGDKFMFQMVINLVKGCNFDKNYIVVNPLWNFIKDNFVVPDNFFVLKNKNYKKGISTSIKLAIKEIISTDILPEYVAIFLADMPFIKKEDIKTIQKYCDGKHLIIAPFFNNKKGFPTFVHKSLFGEIFKLENDVGIKQIINKNPSLLTKVNFNTNRILKDIDD
ncbi:MULTISPECIES: NTP transferase domain-containing protein [unclassified Thermosipho (in: thermotogales)]|uniref:nucleotidyltransferase family protein n=1 Tax=unclassified Thermosipho (in: thermotogales) TaxID=2676525 RepID=UPI0009848491|nr:MULTISPECIES: NTP transferase domain-containing protein [unclassified Thermosipho (in: thermotogales)]MBT1247609.1 hypothetical protein [Thermosipho sp. 1244]OOC46155.1 hypothetical protein XO09_06970 [Thermosipho sp. 1223]